MFSKTRLRFLIVLQAAILTFILVCVPALPAIADDGHNWIIDGNKVYVNDNNVYLSATPHTLGSSGPLIFELKTKNYEGDIDIVFGFSENLTPKSPQIWSEEVEHTKHRWVETESQLGLTIMDIRWFEELDWQEYDGDPNIGNDNNEYLYEVNGVFDEFGENQTLVIAFYDFVKHSQDSYTVYLNYDDWIREEYIEVYPDWKPINLSFSRSNTWHLGLNQWYYVKGATVQKNVTYKLKCWVEVPFRGFEKVSGKYAWGVKPSGENFQEAKDKGHMYLIDPWYDTQWLYCMPFYVDNSASSENLTDFPVLVNLQGYTYLNYWGDEYLYNGTADWQNGDSQGAIEVWFRSSTAAEMVLFGSADTGGYIRYLTFRILATGVLAVYQRNNDTGDYVVGTTNVADGKWHHAILGTNGVSAGAEANHTTDGYKIILDGVRETCSITSGANTGDWFAETSSRDNLSIGASVAQTVVRYYTGGTSMTRVYSRPIGVTEASANYAKGRDGTPSNTTGLVFNLPCTEGTGNPVDTVGALTMTNTGASWVATNFDFSHAQTDGNDWRFTVDNATFFDYEKESYDATTEEGYIHVEIPHIPANTANYTFWGYYGNPSAVDGQDIEGTWNAGYVMVQHMVDTTTSTITDSTSNNNDGTKNGANEPLEAISSVYRGQDYDGNNDRISCGSGATLDNLANMTFEFIFNPDTLGEASNGYMLTKGSSYYFSGYAIYLSSSNRLSFKVDYDTTDLYRLSANNAITLDAIQTVGVRWNGENTSGNITFFIDGLEAGYGASANGVGARVDDSARSMFIGNEAGTSRTTNGLIDEMRVSKVIRSADWIEATHLSLSGQYITFGAEMGYPLAPTNFTATINGNNVDLTWTMGTRADNTTIVYGWAQYPESMSDGIVTFNATGTSHTILGVANPIDRLYLSGFSWNSEYGYNTADYSTAFAGGESMDTLSETISASISEFVAQVANLNDSWDTLNGILIRLGVLVIAVILLAIVLHLRTKDIKEPFVHIAAGAGIFFSGASFLSDNLGFSIVIMSLGAFLIYLVIKDTAVEYRQRKRKGE